MAKKQIPQRITAIAPSEMKESGIHIDRYADRIADIYYGFDVEKICLMDGLAEKIGTCALEASDSIKHIQERLHHVFKIPEDKVVLYKGALVDTEAIYADGNVDLPAFYKESKARSCRMNLIADQPQMELGRDALKALQIEPAEYEVKVPMFSRDSTGPVTIQPPISLDLYRNMVGTEPVAIAGDS